MDYLLEMLKWIQSIRNPGLDHVFTSITVLGEDYFAIAVANRNLQLSRHQALDLIGNLLELVQVSHR